MITCFFGTQFCIQILNMKSLKFDLLRILDERNAGLMLPLCIKVKIKYLSLTFLEQIPAKRIVVC